MMSTMITAATVYHMRRSLKSIDLSSCFNLSRNAFGVPQVRIAPLSARR
jgi:hypothetical protein